MEFLEQTFYFILEKSKFLLTAAAFFLLLEYLRPAHRQQKKWRKESLLDLMYSYALPLLVYPAAILLSSWLTGYFWPVPADREYTRQSLDQKPQYGQVEFLTDGTPLYNAPLDFKGLDQFSVKTEYPRSTVTQTFLVNVVPQQAQGSGALVPPKIFIVEGNLEVSGAVTDGASGFFYRMRKLIGGWHVGWQLLLATFLVDFTGYWRHRLMHSRLLWPFHAIHHSSRELDWLSNERFHPVNTYISYLLSLTVLVLFFENSYILAMSLSIRKAYGMFIHSNVKISYGPLDYVFVSPLFHRWHHSANEMADKNYSTFFSFLDRLFGTYHLPKNQMEPASLGLSQDEMVHRFWPQMVYPFIELARRIAR